MATQTQQEQAARIRLAAQHLTESLTEKAFRSYLGGIMWDGSAGDPGDWRKSPINKFCRKTLNKAGFKEIVVSTYGGVVCLGIMAEDDGEHFEYVNDGPSSAPDPIRECRVTGWDQFQQIVLPAWGIHFDSLSWDAKKPVPDKYHTFFLTKPRAIAILDQFGTDADHDWTGRRGHTFNAKHSESHTRALSHFAE